MKEIEQRIAKTEIRKIYTDPIKGLSKCVRGIRSSSHRGPIISEKKISGSDPGQFHYALITDAQYHAPLS
jgi:hypothetical protein